MSVRGVGGESDSGFEVLALRAQTGGDAARAGVMQQTERHIMQLRGGGGTCADEARTGVLPNSEIVSLQTPRWLAARCFADMIHDLRAVLQWSDGCTAPTALILDN
ncbi:MAG: hypothetical protein IT455_21260 [Planctomycetes bacterium]|nr:hypothetical protein [Planctomycetota bacterium]